MTWRVGQAGGDRNMSLILQRTGSMAEFSWMSIITSKEMYIVIHICLQLVKLIFTQVQLSTTHTLSVPLPPSASFSPATQAASKILGLIESEEGKYQDSLNFAYQDMSEKTFKSLRRALPLTRQKLDWDKVLFHWFFSIFTFLLVSNSCIWGQVLGYKLGAELTASKGVFSAASWC